MCLRISYYRLSRTQGYHGIDTLNQFDRMTQKMLKNFKRFIFLQFLKENVKGALSKSRTLGDFK